MSWMAKLYETYEQALQLELPDKDKPLPISHTLQNAHINIVIDGEGRFRRASVLEKAQIILPATEGSAGRSSGEAPHPLADKLQYVAKDYADYGGLKNAYFSGYQEQLRRWCESFFPHPSAAAVLRYISQGQVIKDLIREKIIYVGDDQKLLTRWVTEESRESSTPLLFKVLPKEKGALDQGSALVCWTVEIDGGQCLNANTWTDASLHQSWISFEADQGAKKGFCFIAGKEMPLATNHPAKIRHTGDKAKLISSNDASGYTYRGKFIDDAESCGIGFEMTQKAHNALRWLVSRQGYRNGDQVIIAWAVSGKKIPSPFENTYSFLDGDYPAEVEEKPSGIDHGINFGNAFAVQLRKKLSGYQAELGSYENIIIMGLDSATPGRMGITYYRESNAKEFFERLYLWHANFSWPQRFAKAVDYAMGKKEKPQIFWFPSVPVPKEIAEAAYGRRLSDSLKKSTVERLLPCIVDQQPFPKDLVDACIHSASNRVGYAKEDVWLWARNVSIACAVYKGFCLQKNPKMSEVERRKFDMSLDRECTSRDYLYGRLLAVAEQIERRALDSKDKGRITNAEGLMQRFSFNPAQTWPVIHDHLVPYKNRLRVSNPGLLWYWNQEIEEISALFKLQEFNDPKPLSGEYLLGYYCQKNYRKPKKSMTGEVINPTENEINQEEI